MEINEFKQKFEDILKRAADAISECSQEQIPDLRIKFLGRKGEIAKAMKLIGKLPQQMRPQAGKIANSVKAEIEQLFQDISSEQKKKAPEIDITMPGRVQSIGGLHPLRTVMREVIEIFYGMGFSVASGPEIETEYYNFDALNTPEDHPARDIQDTFYLPDKPWLLRTQTSPVQIRVMEKQKPPVRVIVPGRCYRRDT
ncbi:phenylalanine--tRNA ligase subunit alpha, partial [bacterium]